MTEVLKFIKHIYVILNGSAFFKIFWLIWLIKTNLRSLRQLSTAGKILTSRKLSTYERIWTKRKQNYEDNYKRSWTKTGV